ncbi:hypothetical protein [Endozoicomonas sp. 4G]|uniref:hypothetical protein n=1 Tax=Endozoicomonas sp. 4G TaxID=2872754 RepID=UPI0020790872|nr:hypothetical protein [Endozoicomonas sp. 4G]
MSIINGSLLADIAKYHRPEYDANTAVMVIDESDDEKWPSETDESWLVRINNQQETLRFCKSLGCRTIVVHQCRENRAKHIYDVIEEPDFSCIKPATGVLSKGNLPRLMSFLTTNTINSLCNVIDDPDDFGIRPFTGVFSQCTVSGLMPFLKTNKITSLVVMGGAYNMCVRDSLVGRCSPDSNYSGLLNHEITVLTSPSLLAAYRPEIYPLEPKFSASACTFSNQDDAYDANTQWPVFSLHKGMRIYTRITG